MPFLFPSYIFFCFFFMHSDMTLVETELSSYAVLLRLHTSSVDIHLLNTALTGNKTTT